MPKVVFWRTSTQRLRATLEGAVALAAGRAGTR
jgi:hypothetical protein